jgi:hypothetical protein
VEETPKKCKDIIKNAKNMLTEAQFAVFGEDSKGNGGGNETKAMVSIIFGVFGAQVCIEEPTFTCEKNEGKG